MADHGTVFYKPLESLDFPFLLSPIAHKRGLRFRPQMLYFAEAV